MLDVSAVQGALREFGIDAWLLCDFRGANVLARRVLGLDQNGRSPGSRRWAYAIPAHGAPRKLVHRIEPAMLDDLPGNSTVYLTWQEYEQGFAQLLQGTRIVAFEYSPRNANPYVARVDAGTIELARALGIEPVSSGNLVQRFESLWDDDQIASHFAAAEHTHSAFLRAWEWIAHRVRLNGSVHELEVQQEIIRHFHAHDLTTYSPPIVAVGPHSGDPHYETQSGEDGYIRQGDFVLIDLWAKQNRPRAVYSDLTRTGFVGLSTPEKYESIFQIVARARDSAIRAVREAIAAHRDLPGWQVDDACRHVIRDAGLGPLFCHRTGHSIGQEVHGNGANIDNLESHEERLILPRTCFSIEPGIYQAEFGVRSEVNVLIDAQRNVHVTGGPLQTSVVPILAVDQS